MRAVEMGHTDTVRILLEHGADVNTKNIHGELHTIIVTISIYPSILLYTFIYIHLCLSKFILLLV